MMKRFLILGLVFSTVALNAGEGDVSNDATIKAQQVAVNVAELLNKLASAGKSVKDGNYTDVINDIINTKQKFDALSDNLKAAIHALQDVKDEDEKAAFDAIIKAAAAEIAPKTSISTKVANVVCYPSDKVFSTLAKSRAAQATIFYGAVAAVAYAVAGDAIKDAFGFNEEISEIEAA